MSERPEVSEELVRGAVRRIGDNLGIAIEDTQKRRVASEAILRDFAAAVLDAALYRDCKDCEEAGPNCSDCGDRGYLDSDTAPDKPSEWTPCPCGGSAPSRPCLNPLCHEGKVSLIEEARAEGRRLGFVSTEEDECINQAADTIVEVVMRETPGATRLVPAGSMTVALKRAWSTAIRAAKAEAMEEAHRRLCKVRQDPAWQTGDFLHWLMVRAAEYRKEARDE